jgi:hypothetical protein
MAVIRAIACGTLTVTVTVTVTKGYGREKCGKI